MNTEVLDQNGYVYFMIKNKSFFVYTKCLIFFNKSFKKKKKTELQRTIPLRLFALIKFSRRELDWMGNLFFNIFFVAQFEWNLILHTVEEWWVRWHENFCAIVYRFACISETYIHTYIQDESFSNIYVKDN